MDVAEIGEYAMREVAPLAADDRARRRLGTGDFATSVKPLVARKR